MINSLELFRKKKDNIVVTKKWLDTRRSYLMKLKSQVNLITGQSDTLRISDYALSNVSLYKKVWFKDSEAAFFNKLQQNKLALCGDFHSSPVVKRFYKRLFENGAKLLDRPFAVALECFEKGIDPLFQKWLQGEVSDEELLEKSKWDENWGFSWTSYKRFILYLKKKGFSFYCVNSLESDFLKRDQQLAQNLKEVCSSYEGPVLFLVGQHHLGPENLPKALEDLSLDPLCLHLDPEEIFFALEEYNLLKDVQVLNLDNHFCFLSTPPWVHWQNHLLHLEELYDEDDDEDFEYEELRGEDFNAVVADYVDLIKKDLSLKEDFKPIDVEFIDEYVIKGEANQKLYEIMQPMLDSETSFYWPEQSEGIMVTGSLNQAAAVAGKYLHSVLRKEQALPWGDVEALNAWCWMEAVGYMLSKLINPKRVASNTQNLSAFLRARLGPDAGKNLMKALVKERVLELDQSLKLGHSSALTWAEVVYAARLKGALVGESLFELYSSGGLSTETLQTYISVPVMDKERFEPFYKLVLERLGLYKV